VAEYGSQQGCSRYKRYQKSVRNAGAVCVCCSVLQCVMCDINDLRRVCATLVQCVLQCLAVCVAVCVVVCVAVCVVACVAVCV